MTSWFDKLVHPLQWRFLKANSLQVIMSSFWWINPAVPGISKKCSTEKNDLHNKHSQKELASINEPIVCLKNSHFPSQKVDEFSQLDFMWLRFIFVFTVCQIKGILKVLPLKDSPNFPWRCEKNYHRNQLELCFAGYHCMLAYTCDFYISIPETSTKHEADVVCMIRPHKAGPFVFVHVCAVRKLVQVNRNACVWNQRDKHKVQCSLMVYSTLKPHLTL